MTSGFWAGVLYFKVGAARTVCHHPARFDLTTVFHAHHIWLAVQRHLYGQDSAQLVVLAPKQLLRLPLLQRFGELVQGMQSFCLEVSLFLTIGLLAK